MITPQMKDTVLKVLCENADTEVLSEIPVDAFLEATKLSFKDFNSILTHFEGLGFIEDLNCRRVAAYLVLKVRATDFYSRGGFAGKR